MRSNGTEVALNTLTIKSKKLSTSSEVENLSDKSNLTDIACEYVITLPSCVELPSRELSDSPLSQGVIGRLDLVRKATISLSI